MKQKLLLTLTLLILPSLVIAAPSRIPAIVDWENEMTRLDALINQRELQSDALAKAISQLETLHDRFPSQADVLSRLAKSYYFIGKFSHAKKLKLDAFKRGRDYAKKGLRINPDHIEANFWYGINLGRYSSTKGGLRALNALREIVSSMKKVISINPKFKNAGAYIVLGRVYFEAPGRPFSVGNKKRAVEHLEIAKKLAGDYYETHAYLMEVYEKLGKMKLAKAEAEWLTATPFEKRWPISAKPIKKKAQEFLQSSRNK